MQRHSTRLAQQGCRICLYACGYKGDPTLAGAVLGCQAGVKRVHTQLQQQTRWIYHYPAYIRARAYQHVEIDGGLWHNDVVLSDGEIMDPGGSRELAQRDLGNLLPFVALSLLLHNFVAITYACTHYIQSSGAIGM